VRSSGNDGVRNSHRYLLVPGVVQIRFTESYGKRLPVVPAPDAPSRACWAGVLNSGIDTDQEFGAGTRSVATSPVQDLDLLGLSIPPGS
jgi:hypothetical protein